MTDPALPYIVIPIASDEAYLVHSERVGAWVEIALSRASRRHHMLKGDTLVPSRLLTMKRIRHAEVGEISDYAAHLEDTAAHAARDELGFRVHTSTDGSTLHLSLVSRLIDPDSGRTITEIVETQTFADTEEQLVQASEQAADWRDRAAALTDRSDADRDAALTALRARYDADDERARSADELRRIVDSED